MLEMPDVSFAVLFAFLLAGVAVFLSPFATRSYKVSVHPETLDRHQLPSLYC